MTLLQRESCLNYTGAIINFHNNNCNNDDDDDNNNNNNNSAAFKFKQNVTGQTNYNSTKNVEIMVSLKCLSDSLRTLEIS